jgi:hypothetical protein
MVRAIDNKDADHPSTWRRNCSRATGPPTRRINWGFNEFGGWPTAARSGT